MNTITILPNGAVIDGIVNDTDVQALIDADTLQVFPSERLGTWFDNVGFLGHLVPVGSNTHGELRNASATSLHVTADDRARVGFHGPVFLVGIDKRKPADLPVEVTVEEVQRLIDLYADH